MIGLCRLLSEGADRVAGSAQRADSQLALYQASDQFVQWRIRGELLPQIYHREGIGSQELQGQNI